VRDCSWHPLEPELATVSWDGSVVAWGLEGSGRGGLPRAPGDDAFDGFF
jgi:WD repeat-containing protein 23